MDGASAIFSASALKCAPAVRALRRRESLSQVDLAEKLSISPSYLNLIENNRRFHRLLTEGVEIEYRRGDSGIVGDRAWAVDWNNPDNNDWLAVNQFTVAESASGKPNPDFNSVYLLKVPALGK